MTRGPADNFGKQALGAVDRVFLVIFGRYRRKLGDAKVESAWRNASNQVSGYLVLPSATVVFVLLAVVESFPVLGLSTAHILWWQILAAAFWLLIALLLDRRFKKYLTIPPRLTAKESHEETMLVLWFRAIAISSFALACLVAIAVHESATGP